MSKRIAVVPEELVTSYFSKTPDVESKIENLLHASSYSDDAKAKLLSQLILKYRHMVSEPKPPVRVTIEEEIPKEKSAEVAERNISEDPIVRDIILSAPVNFQKFIPAIVEKLKTRSYSWNELGELITDNQAVKHSNVIDLFSYLMRNVKKGLEPHGFAVFWKAINEIKIPTRWIGNQKLVQNLGVRISKANKTFRRGYLPGWSDEVFRVTKVYFSHPTTFELQDLKSEAIKRRFYAEELQKISKRSNDYWRIEKVLKTKGIGRKKEYYVKWQGFDERFNSWVKEAWMRVKKEQGTADADVIEEINQSIEEKCKHFVSFSLDRKNINVHIAPNYELHLTAANAPRLLTMLNLPREDRIIRMSERFVFRKPSKTNKDNHLKIIARNLKRHFIIRTTRFNHKYTDLENMHHELFQHINFNLMQTGIGGAADFIFDFKENKVEITVQKNVELELRLLYAPLFMRMLSLTKDIVLKGKSMHVLQKIDRPPLNEYFRISITDKPTVPEKVKKKRNIYN
ncbi:uncharacterized protein TNCT_179791 [Trichonephila clavata]|uniref:Chromo domain-containing protein n=1 Tax=Trichonephila clavata TaxID=2740835 RepID=A0A8X6M163_TRICU|nr:uncharacterized protein TNCT_179791 [Trichonephila clavata]